VAGPNALTYSDYVSELAVLAKYNPTDPNFVQNLPSALNYAEDRINRELNLLTTIASNSSLTLATPSRVLDITAANINVLTAVNIITPATQTDPELGTRNRCTPVTEDYLNAVYNSAATTARPTEFTRFNDHILHFGPFPDQNYTVELIGTVWLDSLFNAPPNDGTQTTWISTYIPDLLLVGSMVWMSGYKMNFGALGDSPQQAMSWETQFQLLKASAQVEDARRKYQSEGWTSQLPEPYNSKRD
jgi:hypothetical protein